MDNGFLSYFKGRRTRWALLLLGVLLAVLLLSSSLGAEEKTEDGLEEYKARLESDLCALASSVRGVGKCRVLITFERGAQNSYKGSELTESRPPLVLGVTVVCEGGARDRVKAELTEMITALFAIPSNRVAVLEYK